MATVLNAKTRTREIMGRGGGSFTWKIPEGWLSSGDIVLDQRNGKFGGGRDKSLIRKSNSAKKDQGEKRKLSNGGPQKKDQGGINNRKSNVLKKSR